MTKIRQSKELTAFYNAYNYWLEKGAPIINKYNFRKWNGLCYQIRLFLNEETDDETIKSNTIKEMAHQFLKAGLDSSYPFGESNYYIRYNEETQHLDPNRNAWVKAHLTEEVDKEFTLQ